MKFSEVYDQQRRNLALRSQQQSNSSVLSSDDEDETRANDVYVTATASEQQESSDEDTSKASQPVIRCLIYMDFYSQILKSERVLLATKCSHIFCSQCLPAAIEVSSACPVCRTKLAQNYHPLCV